jgi:hypothetical protein
MDFRFSGDWDSLGSWAFRFHKEQMLQVVRAAEECTNTIEVHVSSPNESDPINTSELM